ncbi:protein giant [Acyrthosiphon pisum]|uniref:ARID domain-containing protein n=1 Tax=Acyrthosiphon pisum TaxID=7029 RepID=A0A8R2AB37_ACYPI|nr:protein giant [Acyrthosiphon pisum]
MAKRVLDLYTLYKLVVQRGGIVAVITKKLWQEIIRGLGLPPSITSAAFTLRTQYVKYLYAYESRMNQFSTLDELNMAIAGNRREGRRNKSLMYSDMPPPPPGHPHHNHHSHHQQVHGGHPHSMMGGGAPPQPSSQQQQQQQQQQQHQQQQQPPSSHHHHHYANVLAAEDRFRHLAAAIIDNHHHAAAAAAAAAAAGVGVDHPRLRMQSCSPPQHQQQQLQLQPECKTSAVALHQTPRSPATIGLPPPPPMPPSSLFNGHQPSSYQQLHQQQHQSNTVQSTNEQTNKQRELLSMLMWMDIVRANQTAMPRLPISSLPSSPSAAAAAAAAAYTAAAALNLTPTYKGQPMSVVVVPEQSEALNLGKKRTSNNNNSEDEDADGDGPDEYDGGRESMSSAAKRIKTERSSPPVSGCSSDDEKAVAKATSNGSPSPPQPSAADDAAYRSDVRRSSSPIDEDVVEMDINTSATAGPSSNNNGLAISVTRRTKNGVYIGQLTKNNALVNGGLNNNVNPFVLHLNGDLYTGQLKLQQQQVANN